MFDSWLGRLPSAGQVLDAGCGHGKSVIARLLEKVCRVTGTDHSIRMLERARSNFPDVPFVNQMVSDIRSGARFDAACSFPSLLYLDPIDLSHSINRLFHAIKPDGLLFLAANDLHPSWRNYEQDRHEHWMKAWPPGKPVPQLYPSKVPHNLSYCYTVIAGRQRDEGR